MLAVINRGENTERFGERTILFTFQRRLEVITNKVQADQRFVRVRVTNPPHVSHHREQQIVALGNGFGDGLNDICLRGLHQASLDLWAVSQRSGDTQSGIFNIIAGRPGNLY